MSDSSRNGSIEDYSPLSHACVRALTDKLDDKRRFAANEIEKMTVDFITSNNLTMVNRLIIVLGKLCLSHHHQNVRKGGLLGLVAVMAGYRNGSNSEPTVEIVQEVIPPILTCLLDEDPRVRYYAYEALYNVVKVSKANVLPQFEQIFDSLTRIVADIDVGVKTGFETLDKLIKDIIVDQKKNFSINQNFVIKLKEYLRTKNPFTRMFIVSWIQFLDRLNMEIDIVDYLPDLLDGLINCLYDDPDPIRASALNLLSEFLHKIESRPTDKINMNSLMSTILKHAQTSDKDHVQYTAIEWLSKFLLLMDNDDIIKFTPGILSVILPCLALKSTDDHNTSSTDRRMFASTSLRTIPQSLNKSKIRKISSEVNSQLLEQVTIAIQEKKNIEEITSELETILEVLARELSKYDYPVIKLAVLDWFKALRKAKSGFISSSLSQQKIIDNLIDTLSSDSDDVVRETLQVITETLHDELTTLEDSDVVNNSEDSLSASRADGTTTIENQERKKSPARVHSPPIKPSSGKMTKKVAIKSSNRTTNKKDTTPTGQFIQALYRRFSENSTIFNKRGTFIILNICEMIQPELVFRSFADIIREDKSSQKFAYNLVQKLNQILLTTQPLCKLRSRLASDDDPEMVALFQALYSAWCHSPIAAISLCLLTNNDSKANDLVISLSPKDVNVDTLTQIDWLVQLIESPILQPLRMRLLDFNKNQHLIKCLYGLLMNLPQCEARRKLGNLLEEVYRFAITQSHSKSLTSNVQSSNKPSAGSSTTSSSMGDRDTKR